MHQMILLRVGLMICSVWMLQPTFLVLQGKYWNWILLYYIPAYHVTSFIWLNCWYPFSSSHRLPPRESCDLYYVNRDTLFSYHKDSEIFLQVLSVPITLQFSPTIIGSQSSMGFYAFFLQRMMTLYVSSHYKNSPNDLQLMADAPAHHLFVLLGMLLDLQVTTNGRCNHAMLTHIIY